MMPVVEVTLHAVERYRERVADVTPAQARSAMSSRTVQLAADIGAPYVKLPTGHRLAIHQHRVITVLPQIGNRAKAQLARYHWAGQ